jgi:hypothetical protein
MFAVLLLTSGAAATSSIPATAQVNAPARVSPCKASQLSATVDEKESDVLAGGLGHHAMTVAIQNRSSSRCILQGVPAAMFSDQANQSIAVTVCLNCLDYLFVRQPEKEIVVDPHRWAYVLLGYNINEGAGPCRNATTLSLRLQGQRAPLRVGVMGSGRGRPAARIVANLWGGRYYSISWKAAGGRISAGRTQSGESGEMTPSRVDGQGLFSRTLYGSRTER